MAGVDSGGKKVIKSELLCVNCNRIALRATAELMLCSRTGPAALEVGGAADALRQARKKTELGGRSRLAARLRTERIAPAYDEQPSPSAGKHSVNAQTQG